MTDNTQQSETTILFTATSAPQPVNSAAEFTQLKGSYRTDPASFPNGAQYPLPSSDFRGSVQKNGDRTLF